MADSPSSASHRTPAEIIGRMAGEYRLRRKLGEGGFGAVYEAEHPVLKRRAAVKVLHRAAGRDSESVLRFISEAQAANHIRSRNIIDIFSFGRLPDGRHFYVMDLLEGEPLDQFLSRELRLDVATTVQLLRPIAEALDAAHAAGVVHRDLKPQNIFLTWDANGETVPKLLDFGMAKLLGDSPVQTLSGTPMGTPLYMSPEQARGDKVDGRSDVYALGVLGHELLTGRLPIKGDSTVVVLMAHLLQAPPRMSEVCPDLPAAMDEPILRMLDKDPSARPATAGAALSALVEAAERSGIVIPAGMPHLRRPPPAAEIGDAEGGAGGGEADVDDLEASAPMPGRPASARWRLLGAAVALGLALAVLVAVLVAFGVASFEGRKMTAFVAPRSTVSAAPPAPVAPAPPRAPVGAVAQPPVPPAYTAVTVDGAPRGARISVDGKPFGEAPGPVRIPFAEVPVQVTVAAAGYETATLSVTPNRARVLTVKLKKRADGTGRRAPIPSDLESPF